jgi:hypothetical protein
MVKNEAGRLKWQAGPGCLFCKEEIYEPHKGLIVMPSTVTKGVEKLYRIISVGPDVQGFNEGDCVACDKAFKAATGYFVRTRDVLGRLVSTDAPNSAVAVPSSVDAEKLVNDMTAAD